MIKFLVAFAIISSISMPTADDVIANLKQEYPTWISSYEKSVWDCSEQSAYLQHQLALSGILSDIKVGKADGEKNYHVWVETNLVVIEPTTLECYSKGLYDNYILTDKQWDNSEWDWWNSPIMKGE